MTKRIFVGILVVVTILLGFVRDYVFVSINHLIVERDSNGRLSVLKWILTFLFSFLYMLNACLLLHVLFRSKKYILIAVILYGTLFGISCIAILFGWLLSSYENMYPFVRTLMGVAQSPIVMMILISSCYLEKKLS